MTASLLFRYLTLLAAALVSACVGNAPQRADLPTQLNMLLGLAIEERFIPGLSVVVLQGPQVRFARGYGVLDVTSGERVASDSRFQLGSISKLFLAALILRLDTQNVLSIDDPISKYLPELGIASDVRIRHLLSHTSGIRELFMLEPYSEGVADLSRPRSQLAGIVAQAPIDFAPGARWSYSNTNYTVLALLVERLTGKPYERALQESLFEPLALSSLSHCTPLPSQRNEARGHVLGEEPQPAEPENMNWIIGDGGLCGHAHDVATGLRLLAREGTLTERTRLTNGTEVDYGFGVSLVEPDGVRKIAHNGAMLGFSASAAYYPDADLTIVALTNLGAVRTESIERVLAREMLSIAEPSEALHPTSAEAAARVIGEYDIGLFPIRIVERQNELWLDVPPPGLSSPLLYVGENRWICASDPDACEVRAQQSTGQIRSLVLYMGAMHWYAER